MTKAARFLVSGDTSMHGQVFGAVVNLTKGERVEKWKLKRWMGERISAHSANK